MSVNRPAFSLRQGSGVVGLLFAVVGFGIGIPTLAYSTSASGIYAVVGGVELIIGIVGVLMIWQSRTLMFFDAGFEISHFGRVTKLDYADITDAKELLYRGRGDYNALGYCFELTKMNLNISFKVAGRGTETASRFMPFIREKLPSRVYHECDEHDPDYVRILWW